MLKSIFYLILSTICAYLYETPMLYPNAWVSKIYQLLLYTKGIAQQSKPNSTLRATERVTERPLGLYAGGGLSQTEDRCTGLSESLTGYYN